jgi:dTDP-D-glucose 4,6-dehydratase
LGWKPEGDFQSKLKETVQWYLQRLEGSEKA